MNTIDQYIQKIHSSLQGQSAVKISSFTNEHLHVRSLLHPLVRSSKSDISALVYSILRLPPEIFSVRFLLLGQSDRVFEKIQLNINRRPWKETTAIARRRKCKVNITTQTLAAFIASNSDVDDMITTVTALFIEIQKLHVAVMRHRKNIEACFPREDFQKLQEALGEQWLAFIKLVRKPIDWEVTLLAGSQVDYSKAVQEWWIHIASIRKKFRYNAYTQPLYFVSSNSHSIPNILSGFAAQQRARLLREHATILAENRDAFEKLHVPEENILYYLQRFSQRKSRAFAAASAAAERRAGIVRLPPFHHIDIEAQMISVRDCLRHGTQDPRLQISRDLRARLLKSNALILNIAYPLGMAAYAILREVSENAYDMRGVYVMGKAASLNADVGDITIPSTVRDVHANNQIFVRNHFDANTFAPYFTRHSILAQQKAVTVRGTFLQNTTSLNRDFTDGYSIIEMEAAPYLNRVYEMLYPDRYPRDSTFVIEPDFRLGLAYYVSDTPQRKGVNLGAKRLTWEGLNATYAISLGILNDIFKNEARLL